jgi:hypothetical protein
MKSSYIYLLLAVCFLAVVTLLIYGRKDEVKTVVSDYDLCYGSGSSFETQVNACGNLVRISQEAYPIQEKKLIEIANNAS